jgi:alpha-glucuronidase
MALLLILGLGMQTALAEDGYDLWLRYRPLPTDQAQALQAHLSQLVIAAQDSPGLAPARDELEKALGGLLGAAPPCRKP